jgi:hypothetical protein
MESWYKRFWRVPAGQDRLRTHKGAMCPRSRDRSHSAVSPACAARAKMEKIKETEAHGMVGGILRVHGIVVTRVVNTVDNR